MTRAVTRPVCFLLGLAAAWCLMPSLGSAQDTVAPAAPPASTATSASGTPAPIPARITLSTRDIVLDPDGSSTIVAHSEMKLLAQSAIGGLSQPAISYDDALQQMDVVEAYTLKADQRKIPVAADAIITQQSPASARSPMLSDLKQKVILFPNVEVGDTIVFTIRTRSHPQLPGAFTYDVVFPRLLPIAAQTITVTVPKPLSAHVETRDMTVDTKSEGASTVYTVHYANPDPGAHPVQAVSEFDLAPRFSLSTFADYDALAKNYAALALPMAAVTPQIQQQADSLTAGITEPRAQAEKIYQFVARHVRYVAVEFGQGFIVPHTADSVLTNAYGDCKDHAVLFAALLKAKGIDSNMALINATNGYTAAKVATLAPFNHVITWLPAFKLYADTTNGGAVAFGLLPGSEYGKPVIHVADAKGALHRIPVSSPADSTDHYTLDITADEAGHIVSHSIIAGTGNFAAPLRVMGAALQGDNGAKIAASILSKSRMPRATGALAAAPLTDDNAGHYEIAANYSTPGIVTNLANGGDFRMIDNLRLASPVSGVFFGPAFEAKYKDSDPVPCANGHATTDETLNYPATRHLKALPADAELHTAHIRFSSHWSAAGNSVTVHREFETRFDSPLCGGSVKSEIATMLEKVKTENDVPVAVPRSAS